MKHNRTTNKKGSKMNTAAKQLKAVEKALGALAYEDVFIYPTSNENWIELRIAEPEITMPELRAMLGNKFRFNVEVGNHRAIFVSKIISAS